MDDVTAEDLKAHRFISYEAPLEIAKRWRKSKDPGKTEEAEKLLIWLRDRFPHVMRIDEELVVVLLELQKVSQAVAVLKQLSAHLVEPSEEIISRWGRVFRGAGDAQIKLPDLAKSNAAPQKTPTEGEASLARSQYEKALEKYQEAYAIRKGHYPGVNVASLHLVLASLSDGAERESHLRASRKVARDLLRTLGSWPSEQEDDNVWHLLTAAECHFLLGEFEKAKQAYRDARAQLNYKKFHGESARKALERNQIFCRLGEIEGFEDLGPLADLDHVFLTQDSDSEGETVTTD